ncbi:MAG TPA: tetratricopeptide repeat protein [Pirellulales bacterium]|jgi:tetratricopeptide (TPR) repeat protein|nr:tetratricopeptide repeat protein [Pirellulales bacterium]
MRHAILWTASLAVLTAAGTALATDRIKLTSGSTTSGDVVEMGPTEVKLEVSGVPKTLSVNQIEFIQFDDEPKDLTAARTAMRAGKLHEALALVKRVNLGEIKRDEIKQDVEFYKAFLMARLALAGSGSLKEAGEQLRDFEKGRKNSYHALEASAALGDLLVASGRAEKAAAYYAPLASTPWPEYRVRAAVLQGRALEAQQEYDKAIEKYDEALAITADGKEADSQHFAAELGKASALAAGGKIDDAVKLIDEVIAKADPDNQEIYARAYVALGNCYKAAGKPKEALLAFLEVDLLYPGSPEQHAEALANLAVLWAKVDKAERAAQARELLERRYPHSHWITKPPSAPTG